MCREGKIEIENDTCKNIHLFNEKENQSLNKFVKRINTFLLKKRYVKELTDSPFIFFGCMNYNAPKKGKRFRAPLSPTPS